MAVANPYLMEELYELSVANALVTDLRTGVEMYSVSLKSHNVAQTSSSTQIKAGQQNATFLELKNDKEITAEIVDIQSKRDWEALKLGGNLETKTVRVSQFPHNATVANEAGKNVITLPSTPAVGQKPVIYNKKTGVAIDDSKITILDKKVTIEDNTVNVADIVFVGSYLHEVEAETIEFKNDASASTVRLELDIPVINGNQEVVFIKKVVFHKASLGEDFTMEGTAEKTESAISTKFTILQHADYDSLGFMSYIPVK